MKETCFWRNDMSWSRSAAVTFQQEIRVSTVSSILMHHLVWQQDIGVCFLLYLKMGKSFFLLQNMLSSDENVVFDFFDAVFWLKSGLCLTWFLQNGIRIRDFSNSRGSALIIFWVFHSLWIKPWSLCVRICVARPCLPSF